MKAVGYIRVSTEGQATDGVSLDAQRSRIEAWVAAHGRELIALLADEGASGKRADNRPGLIEAVALAKKEKAALVVYSLSRFSRSVLDTIILAQGLEAAGADLVSLTEEVNTTTPTGKAFFRILAVLAELERDMISERTKAALGHLRANGRRFTRWTPYGFDLGEDGKTLTRNEQEHAVIERVKTLRSQGLSLREVATELNTSGVRAKQGGPWNGEGVRRLLNRREKK